MSKRKGFTLIELLVVISIIALLLSILMPALGKVKAQAKQLTCSAGNLKSLAMVNALYAAEYDGKYMHTFCWPGNTFFRATIEDEKGGWDIDDDHRCPADIRERSGVGDWNWIGCYSSYGYNSAPEGYDTEYDEDGIVSPSSKIMFMCSAGPGLAPPRSWQLAFTHWEDMGDPDFIMPYWAMPTFRHSNKTNTAYFDGHISSTGMKDLYFLNDTESEWDDQKMEAIWMPDPSRSNILKGRW